MSIIELIQAEIASVTERDLLSAERNLSHVPNKEDDIEVGFVRDPNTRRLLALAMRHGSTADEIAARAVRDATSAEEEEAADAERQWELQLADLAKELFWTSVKMELRSAGRLLQSRLGVRARWSLVRMAAPDDAEETHAELPPLAEIVGDFLKHARERAAARQAARAQGDEKAPN